MVYLICTPSAFGPAALGLWGTHIRQTTLAHVTNTKCTLAQMNLHDDVVGISGGLVTTTLSSNYYIYICIYIYIYIYIYNFLHASIPSLI